MKHRQIINLLYVAVPVCVLLRIMQLKFTIDATTGFIKQPYRDISMLISFVVFAAIIAMCVLAYFSESVSVKTSSTQPIVAFSCVLTGGLFVCDSVSSVVEINDIYSIFLILLGLISAVAFILFGIEKIYPLVFPKALLIAPTVYYIVKLIKLFVSTSELSLVTENIFLLFTHSALLCFVFEFASYENNFGDSARRQKKLFACGITSTMLCIVTALPKLLLPSTLNEQTHRADVSSCLLLLSQAVFVLLYIISNFCSNDKPKAHISKHS